MASTNFSRPRRPSEGQAMQRAANTLSVVSERDEDLPSEPRFSCDSDRQMSRSHYADGHGHGHDQSMRAQPLGVRDQRYPGAPNNAKVNAVRSQNSAGIPDSLTRAGFCNPTMPIPPDSPRLDMPRRDSDRSSAMVMQRPGVSRKNSNGTNSTTMARPRTSSRSDSNATTSTSTTRPPGSSRSNSASTSGSTNQPFVPKSILKVTTVEQTSERSGSRSDSAAGSSSKSSDSGSIAVSYDTDGKFVASEYDTSELSEKEIKKLQKKGTNPALALEMKALRKGKSFGNLVGNAYVS